jgi:hypothetical protein
LTEGFEEEGVLGRGAYRNPQAAGAEGDAMAIADDDAAADEEVVRGVGVVEAREEEIGVGGEDLAAAGKRAEGIGHEGALG